MKRALLFAAIAALMLSCKTTNQPVEDQMVDVTVSIDGIDIQVTPEDGPSNKPAESDKNATQAGIKYIVLNVYDATADTLVKSVSQDSVSDKATFGTISLRLHVGSYKFVAVAHSVTSGTTGAMTINSSSEVSYGSALVGNPTYILVKDVTISGNDTQSVTMDMGTRKNATFGAKFTDDQPSDVKKLQLIVSPSSTAYTDLKIAPSTGLAASQWKYEKTLTFSNLSGFSTTKGVTFNLPIMLTAANQTLNVTINALSSADAVLYTRTLFNVTFKQGHKTLATGTFFSPSTTETFSFDVTEPTENTSLD